MKKRFFKKISAVIATVCALTMIPLGTAHAADMEMHVGDYLKIDLQGADSMSSDTPFIVKSEKLEGEGLYLIEALSEGIGKLRATGTNQFGEQSDSIFEVCVTFDQSIPHGKGDVDNNAVTDEKDVKILQKYFTKKNPTPIIKNFMAADMNDDGKVNVFDIVALKRYIKDGPVPFVTTPAETTVTTTTTTTTTTTSKTTATSQTATTSDSTTTSKTTSAIETTTETTATTVIYEVEPGCYIQIDSLPDRTDFGEGEDIDLTGLRVSLYFAPGGEQSTPPSESDFKPVFRMVSPGAYPEVFTIEAEAVEGKENTYSIIIGLTEAAQRKYWYAAPVSFDVTAIGTPVTTPQETELTQTTTTTTSTTTTTATTSEAKETTTRLVDVTYATQMLELINADREKAGKAPLKLNVTLVESANIRAEELSEDFSHTRPDGSKWHTVFDIFGAKFQSGIEQIIAGDSTVEQAYEHFKKITGYEDCLLSDDLTDFGLGYYYDPISMYKYHWVQIFAKAY